MRAELVDDGPHDRHGRTIVYVPGIDGGGHMLLDTADRIRERHRLVRLRYRHEDGLDRSDDGYPRLAHSVAERLRDQSLERPILLAESFGVALALQVALQTPEHVGGLFLVNGFPWFPNRIRLAIVRAGAPLVNGPVVGWFQRWVGMHVLFGRSVDQKTRDALAYSGGTPFGPGYLRRLGMVGEVDLRPELADVRAPVSVFASTRDWIVPSRRTGRLLERDIPDARLEVLRGRGHVVLPLDEEPWLERIAELCERVERAEAAGTTSGPRST